MQWHFVPLIFASYPLARLYEESRAGEMPTNAGRPTSETHTQWKVLGMLRSLRKRSCGPADDEYREVF